MLDYIAACFDDQKHWYAICQCTNMQEITLTHLISLSRSLAKVHQVQSVFMQLEVSADFPKFPSWVLDVRVCVQLYSKVGGGSLVETTKDSFSD